MRSFVLGCVGASAVSLASALSPSRMLLEAQAFTVDSFDLVDLSGVPVGATGAVPVDGVPQGSGLGVSVTENTAPTFGTYALPPAAASALSEAILELVRSLGSSMLRKHMFHRPVSWTVIPA